MNFQILQGGSHSLFSSSLAWGYQVGGGSLSVAPAPPVPSDLAVQWRQEGSGGARWQEQT